MKGSGSSPGTAGTVPGKVDVSGIVVEVMGTIGVVSTGAGSPGTKGLGTPP